jgi:hypothetical protein
MVSNSIFSIELMSWEKDIASSIPGTELKISPTMFLALWFWDSS